MARLTQILAGTAVVAGSTLFAAPAFAAAGSTPSVSAQPGLTYTIKGTTANFVIKLTGTQHQAKYDVDGSIAADPGPTGLSADFGDGSGTGGDAPSMTCLNNTKAPLNYELPYTHTYKKPGTYKVTLDFQYCGDANNSHVKKTFNVVVPPLATTPAPAPAVTGTPTQPAPSTRVTSPSKSAPAAPSAPAAKPGSAQAPAAPSAPANTAPKTGPKVVTDHVGQPSDAENKAVLYGGSAAVVAGLAGGAYALRRRARN